jgi:hypothetical protein
VTEFSGVEAALSVERLEPYSRACGGDLRAAVDLYVWNTAVSGAFYESLAYLEVGLRNALHDQLRRLAHRDDWWESPLLTLAPAAVDMIAKAKRDAGRRADGKPGRVVAALQFGFWVGLVSSGRSCNYEMILWRPALHRAFPGYRGPRPPLHERLEKMRLLRNRVAHHEPIHQRPLVADHDDLLAVAGWISADFAGWIRSTSRFASVLADRPPVG